MSNMNRNTTIYETGIQPYMNRNKPYMNKNTTIYVTEIKPYMNRNTAIYE